MKWIQMLLTGGFVLWLLIACFILIVLICVERFKALQKAKVNIPTFSIKIRNLLKKKEIQSAIDFCMEDKSSIANVMRRGLKKIKFGRARFLQEIDSAGRQEISKLEKGIPVLATLATVSPMLGFLGTVMGMVSTFRVIQDLQSGVTVADFAGGIWEALITSAVGLIVGMIALAMHNYFVSAIKIIVLDIERVTNDLIDVIDGGEKDSLQAEESEYEV